MAMKRKNPPAAVPPDRRGDRSDPPVHTPEDLHDLIAQRAYEIYEQRLRQGALDDWLEAERQIQPRRRRR